jgi:hypothetical protein
MLPTLWESVGWPGEEEAAVSSAEENKAIVSRYLEEVAKGNLDG